MKWPNCTMFSIISLTKENELNDSEHRDIRRWNINSFFNRRHSYLNSLIRLFWTPQWGDWHDAIFAFYYLECKAKIDIGFLVDSSGSIEKSGKGNYKKCLDFIKTAVNGSFISETYTHVGVVLFSSKVCAIMKVHHASIKNFLYNPFQISRNSGSNARRL